MIWGFWIRDRVASRAHAVYTFAVTLRRIYEEKRFHTVCGKHLEGVELIVCGPHFHRDGVDVGHSVPRCKDCLNRLERHKREREAHRRWCVECDEKRRQEAARDRAQGQGEAA